MKNKLSIWFLLFACGFFLTPQVVLAAEIMNDGIDAGTFTENGWTLAGGSGVAAKEWTLSVGNFGNPGNYIWGGGSGTMQEDIVSGTLSKDTGYVIQDADSFTLTFDIKDMTIGIDLGGAVLATLYYMDGATVQVLGSVEHVDSADIPQGWDQVSGTLAVSATAGAVGKNLHVSFAAGPSSWNGTSAQRIGIDNVVIEQSRDERAKNPTPYGGQGVDDASKVSVDLAALSWQAPTAFTPDGYRVFFGTTEPNLLDTDDYGLTELTDGGVEDITSIDPTPVGDLDDDTQYYWVVDSYEPNAVSGIPFRHKGDTWTFATAVLAPFITAGPTDTAAFAGGQADLQIEFDSQAAITNNDWEVSTDGGTTWVAASGTVSIDEASTPKLSTLTIASVALGDEGLYRCSLSNDSGSMTTVSANAELVVKRRLAYYEFEGNADDSEGSNDGTAKNVDPALAADITYAVGVVGTQAVVFNISTEVTDPNQSFIELSETAYPNNAIGGGLKSGTICCWIKSTTGEGAVMGNINGTAEDPDQEAWYFRYTSPTQFRFFMRDDLDSPTNAFANDPDLSDGTWYFVAATWQGGDESRIYVGRLGQNGRLDDAGSFDSDLDFSVWQNPQVIGGYYNRESGVTGFLPQGAMIDDLQIFNYPLSADEVAGIYHVVNGDLMCTALNGEFDGSEYDINNDCIVNLGDFAIMATQWLSGALSDGTP